MQRMTKQRQAVLDELTRVTDFRSAQQIFEDLHLQGQRVDSPRTGASIRCVPPTASPCIARARATIITTTWCVASAASPKKSSSLRSSRG